MKVHFVKQYCYIFAVIIVAFNLRYSLVLGTVSITITLIILSVSAFKQNEKYHRFKNDLGGITLRVSKEKGSFTMPDEFPTDIVDVYPSLRLRNIYIERDKNDEIAKLKIEAYSDDTVDTVKKYYEDEESKLLNKDYKVTFIIDEANSEFLPEKQRVSEKTKISIIVKKK